jgi:hypothetical protein
VEELLRLVPAVEHTRTRGAAPSRVGRHHDCELRSLRTQPVDGAQCRRDIATAVEHDDVGVGVRDLVDDAVRRGQLLDLEAATLEEEARKFHEARVAARNEDACTRLWCVLPHRPGRVRTRVRHAPRRPRHPVADLETSPVALTRRKLHHLTRPPAGRGPPWPHISLDRDHDLVRVEEHDIDREVHEVRVNRKRRAQHHALSRVQAAAPEEAAHAAVNPVGHDTTLAHDPTVFPAERQRAHGSTALRRCE